MKISLEYLYHCHCQACGRWWSHADIAPHIGDLLYCPFCGFCNHVESIETFRQAAQSPCLSKTPDPPPLSSQAGSL
ncbi:MAG: hypothetical protein NW237_16155 [Cyanobacteriota bacterium]|nr:hypothetical protein [Cyanobacteriota bacterium]